MIAHAQTLGCRVDATAGGHRDGPKKALERQLDRFALREAPLSLG